jgi:hypothetical protein
MNRDLNCPRSKICDLSAVAMGHSARLHLQVGLRKYREFATTFHRTSMGAYLRMKDRRNHCMQRPHEQLLGVENKVLPISDNNADRPSPMMRRSPMERFLTQPWIWHENRCALAHLVLDLFHL